MRLGYDQQLFDDQRGLLQKVQGNGLALSNLEGPAGSSMNGRAKGQSLNYRIVASTNTCYYSEKSDFLQSRIVTRRFFFRNKTFLFVVRMS